MTRPTLPHPLASLLLLTLLLLTLLLLALPAAAQTTPPDPFLARIQAGQTALRAGLPLVAVREYRAAVRLRPADADAHYALAGVLEAAGRADEAMGEYRHTLALRPDDAPAHNALAGLLEDKGEHVMALAQYRQAVALDPADPRLRFNLAGSLADAGRRGEAAAQYREALRLKPDFAEAAQALRALPAGGQENRGRKDTGGRGDEEGRGGPRPYTIDRRGGVPPPSDVSFYPPVGCSRASIGGRGACPGPRGTPARGDLRLPRRPRA